MKKHLQPLTPAALYARVSSDRQDVDLPVAAHLPRLGPTNQTVQRQLASLVRCTNEVMLACPLAASRPTAHEYRNFWCRLSNRFGLPPDGQPAPAS